MSIPTTMAERAIRLKRSSWRGEYGARMLAEELYAMFTDKTPVLFRGPVTVAWTGFGPAITVYQQADDGSPPIAEYTRTNNQSSSTSTQNQTIYLNPSYGTQGPQGPAGPQGPRGPQGFTGPQGFDGVDGEQGPDGQQGADGPQGEEGEQGPQGPPGVNGLDGEPGEDGLDGLDGLDGEDNFEEGPPGDPGPAFQFDRTTSSESRTVVTGSSVGVATWQANYSPGIVGYGPHSPGGASALAGFVQVPSSDPDYPNNFLLGIGAGSDIVSHGYLAKGTQQTVSFVTANQNFTRNSVSADGVLVSRYYS